MNSPWGDCDEEWDFAVVFPWSLHFWGGDWCLHLSRHFVTTQNDFYLEDQFRMQILQIPSNSQEYFKDGSIRARILQQKQELVLEFSSWVLNWEHIGSSLGVHWLTIERKARDLNEGNMFETQSHQNKKNAITSNVTCSQIWDICFQTIFYWIVESTCVLSVIIAGIFQIMKHFYIPMSSLIVAQMTTRADIPAYKPKQLHPAPMFQRNWHEKTRCKRKNPKNLWPGWLSIIFGLVDCQSLQPSKGGAWSLMPLHCLQLFPFAFHVWVHIKVSLTPCFYRLISPAFDCFFRSRSIRASCSYAASSLSLDSRCSRSCRILRGSSSGRSSICHGDSSAPW